jgi:uncharacterized protein (DUF362 family)
MIRCTRRDFVRYTLAGAGLMLVPWPRDGLAAAESVTTPELMIAKGSAPSQITEAAIHGLGGMRSFVSRGDVVVIKPNIAWDRVPEQAATTNPEVVATLVRLCLDAGAKEVKIFDHTCEDSRRTYVRSGVMKAGKDAGARVSHVNERRFRKMRLKGDVLKEWEVYPEAVEADKLINVPILKHHSLARVTMGMKNLMGLIGGSRARLHWDLDRALVDLGAFFTPTLVVLDAVRVLTANGPQGGSLKYVNKANTVAAGKDQVAVEALGATLFGLTPDEFAHIAMAHERGLGEMDVRALTVQEVDTNS